MPIHDWTRVASGSFHHFHQDWSIEIARALNRGRLPKGVYAYVEQRVNGPEPDVIAVETRRPVKPKRTPGGGTAVLAPPRTSLVQPFVPESTHYARKANRIAIRHHHGEVVAVIEIVSPGNKDSRNSIRSFVAKAVEFLNAGVHLLAIDLFPPTPRDPQGIHKAIAEEILDLPFELPAGKRLTFVSYCAGEPLTAYIEPLAVGDDLPNMPLFLDAEDYIFVPLAETYATTYAVCPEPIRAAIEGREIED